MLPLSVRSRGQMRSRHVILPIAISAICIHVYISAFPNLDLLWITTNFEGDVFLARVMHDPPNHFTPIHGLF